jgi:serpin B
MKTFIASVAALIAGISCTPMNQANSGTDEPAKDLPALSRTEIRATSQAAESINRLAFRLANVAHTTPGENRLISPYSIWTCLALLREGTAGESKNLLSEALFANPSTASDAIDGQRILGQRMVGTGSFTTANSIWLIGNLSLKSPYVQTANQQFAAEIRETASPAETVGLINDWVKSKTKDRIQKLFDILTNDTQLVLANALTFDGKWETTFDKSRTKNLDFTTTNGKVSVPTLSDARVLYFSSIDGAKMIRLDYAGGEFGLEILLPKPGAPLVAQADQWKALSSSLKVAQNVPIQLPKFKLSDELDLREPMAALGLGPLFDAIDITTMTDAMPKAALDQAVHKTFIELDEEGTKAAAVTGLSVQSVVSIQEFDFIADRPFLYAIKHIPSGTILFLGAIEDPSK